jgi:HSP20 family protein
MPGAFPGAGGPFNPLSFLNAFLGGNDSANEAKSGTQEFRPDADVFDTESAYVIHVSLPGAQKEDVGVNWDADKSELSVAGVVYRPGVDEELLKSLALDERRVGVFERKIRLGTPANPAQVEVDAITAKMENGVLVVEVPKLDRDYVDVKKVDVL